MRFCQALMTELIATWARIPTFRQVISALVVVSRLYGGDDEKALQQYRLRLPGKGLSFGGSLIRPEATGYGWFISQKQC